jgi:hypothetical protein
MSDEMAVSGVPTREDCASCPETGDRCALHQSMLERQQQAGDTNRTQQAHTYASAGHGHQRATEQSHMSKIAAREMNRAKTQEGQMISVSFVPLLLNSSQPLPFVTTGASCGVTAYCSQALRRMNFNESKREHNLSKKQKQRLRRREDAALHADPVKIAQKQEKAAQRAEDPERIARLEAHNQKTAENKARTQAKRARNVKESRQHSSGRLLMDVIKTETSEALEHAPAPQTYGAGNGYGSSGPTVRTRGQRAAHQVNMKLQDLATVHSMPEETGTDAFLTRADSLIHQTLSSNSTLSPTERQNLEEALSLVRTVQLLSTKDYRPCQSSTADYGRLDRVLRGPDSKYGSHGREAASKDVPIKREHTSDADFVAQEHGAGFQGHHRGGSSNGFNLAGVSGQDAMVE